MRRELTQKFVLPLGVRESLKTQAHRLKGGLAQPSDDARLRDFLWKMSMPGAIKVAYLREPGFFQALQVEGRHNDVVMGRDKNTGHIVGFGTRSVKTAFINGHPSPLGYLSSLRLLKEYQRGIYLASG